MHTCGLYLVAAVLAAISRAAANETGCIMCFFDYVEIIEASKFPQNNLDISIFTHSWLIYD